MAVGDIVGPDFDIVYRKKSSGYTVNVGGVVAFDSSGDIQAASTTTLGKHGVLTALTHAVSGTTYYGVLMRGKVVVTAGGAIKPNAFVVSDASAQVVTVSQSAPVSTAFVQSEIQALYGRIFARYLRLASDNQYAATDAASTDLVIVEVGALV